MCIAVETRQGIHTGFTRNASGAAADGGDHAAGIFGLAPVRKEEIRLASGTTAAVIDVAQVDACSAQLAAVGFRKIQPALAQGWRPLRKDRMKFLGHVVSDFVTAGADTRADRRVNVRGIGAERAAQSFDGSLYDSGGSSPPAGVYGRQCTMGGIEQQNGDAIGSPNTNTPVHVIGDQRIPFAGPISKPVSIHDRSGMDLPKCDAGGWIAQPGAKTVRLPSEIFSEGVAAVNSVRREVKRGIHDKVTSSPTG